MSIENIKTPYQLETNENKIIEQKIDQEIIKSHLKMINIGCITNIISGLVMISILYKQISMLILLIWYFILVFLNVINVIWAYYKKEAIEHLKGLKLWRKYFLIIFSFICLTWGIITIIFNSSELHFQYYLLAFLLAVLIGFSFSSVTDFTPAIISIIAILTPTILYYFFIGIKIKFFAPIYLGISAGLLILGIFLIVVSLFGSKLVRRFFQLSFINVALSKKLEGINASLEQRVKERTIELERTLAQVSYQANHDLLTNLPNQRSLVRHLETTMADARKKNATLALAFFSLNEIDRIYNALGYQASNRVLKTIARRFQTAYRKSDYIITLARNDVFVIVIYPIDNIDAVEEKIRPLFKILEKAVLIEKQIIKLTASIGVSLYPQNGKNINSLLMNADAAMLLAKQSGGNHLIMYTPEINAAISKQLELESKLQTALIQSEFSLEYQPLFDLHTGQIASAEALVRWENPSLGRVPPDSFIPLAETNGIIIPLGEWVFNLACNTIKKWHNLGFTDLKMSINLSAKQLQYRYLTRMLSKILNEVDIDPKFLELELTESFAFRKDNIHVLQELKAIGFCLSIDDFGIGYSNLSSLKLLTIDKIKIDKSFIQDVVSNTDSQAIISNTIALARGIDVKVVAEGIETKEQLEFITNQDCDYAQGYFISPPVSAEEFIHLVGRERQM
jgi:diguanylate cyclase (GGDEF)-like protein